LIVREAGGAVEGFTSAAVPLDDPAFIAASTPDLLDATRQILAG
jgi:hypothetical protein